MRLQVYRTADEATSAASRLIARKLREQPASVLALPTGQTWLGVYDELARLCALGRLDFSHVRTFNIDEFVGVSPRDAGSFRAFMERQLFSRVNLRSRRIHFLNGRARDLDGECARFERAIHAAGGLDLLLLGVGLNGHIGFNEPSRKLQARTHRARLRPETRRANAPLFQGRVRDVPRSALTMGMATLLEARSIILLATGTSKRAAVRALVSGDVTTEWPVTLLQLHHDVEVMLDRASALA
jgi:glucosamine-6-phosphate deaminase